MALHTRPELNLIHAATQGKRRAASSRIQSTTKPGFQLNMEGGPPTLNSRTLCVPTSAGQSTELTGCDGNSPDYDTDPKSSHRDNHSQTMVKERQAAPPSGAQAALLGDVHGLDNHSGYATGGQDPCSPSQPGVDRSGHTAVSVTPQNKRGQAVPSEHRQPLRPCRQVGTSSVKRNGRVGAQAVGDLPTGPVTTTTDKG